MTVGIGDGKRQARIAAALALLSAVVSVALLACLPVAIFAVAGHDDAWFWHRAQSVVAGDWLGEYDQYTLMKGAGYPLFLALNHVLGASLSLSQAALYAIACLLLAHGVYRNTGRPWLALLLVLLMQWHPMAMGWERVIRDNIYAAQTLLVLGCLLQCFAARSVGGRLAWAVLSGGMLGWLWLTREDGIWILPGLAILLGARLIHARRADGELRRLAAACVLMTVCFVLTLGSIAATNWARYGRFETVDLKGAAFGDAISALQSVRAGAPVAYVPVPEPARRAVYAASPTFARLQPYLEGAGRHWTDPGCRLYAQACGDYAGGWFLWAFRDAVASVGGYESPQAADAFYRAIAREIGDACSDGVLDCGGAGIGLMPAITAEQWHSLPGTLSDGAVMAAWHGVSMPGYRSRGSKSVMGRMWRFVGSPRVADSRGLSGKSANGWFYDPRNAWLRIGCPSSGYVRKVARKRSPDIQAHFSDPLAGNRRFELDVPPDADCVLEAGAGNDYAHVVRIADVGEAPMSLRVGEATLYFDSVGAGIDADAVAPARALAWKQGIHRAYGIFMPWLAAVGVLAFLCAAVLSIFRRRSTPMFAVACAAWALVASRIVLLSLVDISSFPAVNVQYMQPVFPLVVLAAVASLACLAPPQGRRTDGAGKG